MITAAIVIRSNITFTRIILKKNPAHRYNNADHLVRG